MSDYYEEKIGDLNDVVTELEEQLEAAEKVIDFYGDEASQVPPEYFNTGRPQADFTSPYRMDSGKRAREYQVKYKGGKCMIKCDKCDESAWYHGNKNKLCREHYTQHQFMKLEDKNIKLKYLLDRYSENVDYYKGELAGSWFDIQKDADELIQ